MRLRNMILIILVGIFLAPNLFAQEQKDITKMERFISKAGDIIRFEDYNLPVMKAYSEILDNKIRKVKSLDEGDYFFVITKKGKYSNKNAGISAEDLSDVIEALKKLKNDADKDYSIENVANPENQPNYLENKFRTEDGFEVGYAIGESLTWFIVMDKYGSDNTVLFKDYNTILNAFQMANSKIKSLKQRSKN